MTSDNAEKVVTSVLLCLTISEQDRDAFYAHCDRIVERGLELPEPEMKPLESDPTRIWCTFDLTSAIDEGTLYDAALEGLLIDQEAAICALANYDRSVPVRLSALVSVDEGLAAFRLKTPRLPTSVARLENFEFDYFVWHILQDRGPGKMKNIQVIDGALNCTYSVFQATTDEFALLFPEPEQEVQFSEDLAMDQDEVASALQRIWERPIRKRDAQGIHGTLYWGLEDRKGFYRELREDGVEPGAVNSAQRRLFGMSG
jgi:hypothetical protein